MKQPKAAPLADMADPAPGKADAVRDDPAEPVGRGRRRPPGRRTDEKDGIVGRADSKGYVPGRRSSRRGMRRAGASLGRRRNNLKGYLFVSPAVVLFLAFIAVPIAGIIIFSFLQWDLLTPPKFAGLSNFRMLAHDPQLAQALFNSLIFDLMTTSLHIIVGMTLAIAVTSVSSRVVRYWARTAFVVPFPDVGRAPWRVMWGYILSGSTGPLNYYLERIGMHPPDWLASGTWALPSLVVSTLGHGRDHRSSSSWSGCRPSRASCTRPPPSMGSGRSSGSGTITLPMLSPATLVASVTAFIGAFEIFTWPYVTTNGGPGNRHPDDHGLHLSGRVQKPPARLRGGRIDSQRGGPRDPRHDRYGRSARRWVHYERV